MPRADKSANSAKHKREAGPFEDSYRQRGASSKRAERIAWATVHKQSGGGGPRKNH